MEVVVTTVTIRHVKLQSNQHTTFTGQMPFLSPNQLSKHRRERVFKVQIDFKYSY